MDLRVVTQPNQPALVGVTNKPNNVPATPLPVVNKPASLPAKLPVTSKPAGVQERLSVAAPAQLPGINVPPRPPQFDKIASDIGVARSRGADDTTILYSLVKKNPSLTEPVKAAIQERKATPTQVLDTIIEKYRPRPVEEPKGFFSKLKADINKRRENVGQAKIATDRGEQSKLELGLQFLGQSAGVINDFVGESVSAVTPDFVKRGASKVVEKVSKYPVNPLNALKEVADTYGQFKENNPRAARNVESVANIASLIPVGKSAKVAQKTAVQASKTAAKTTAKTVSGVTKFGVSQATGLSPETVTRIIKNPKAITAAQKAGLDRVTLANRVKEGIDNRLIDLSETGKAYEAIRKSSGTVIVPKNTVDDVLSKYGLSVKNGKLATTAESVPLSSADKTAIEGFIKQYGSQEKLSGNGFLNARKSLSNMAAYDATKTDISNTISRELRSAYDELGKKQLDGLESLDAKYSPEVKLLKQIRRDYLNPDGTLKDGALNKIANLTGKGKDQTLTRLEQVVPDIREDINILNALEDIEYTKGQKVGAYLRGAGGGFVLSGGNPYVAIISAIVSAPQIAVPILKAYGRLVSTSNAIINNIISKLKRGIKPAVNEARIISEAIENYARDFVDNPKIGLQIKNVNKPVKINPYNPKQPGAIPKALRQGETIPKTPKELAGFQTKTVMKES